MRACKREGLAHQNRNGQPDEAENGQGRLLYLRRIYFIQTSMPWSLAGFHKTALTVLVYIWILGVRFIYVGLTRPNDLCGTPFFPLLSRLDMNQGSCPFGQ